ncbi:MAG: ABC transporter substrate-binding protein [Pseudomonadales bacterium]|nr:ABC transporter substrate-binding protein [Pseudomonadales bacterium]
MDRYTVTLFAFLSLFASSSTLAMPHQSHAIAMHGEAQYAADFKHFNYNNPSAPKGGKLKLGGLGGFDSLNPFIAKGNVADDIGLIYDTLTVASADEPFTRYGLVAKTIIWPDDRSWVAFELNPKAQFHDGKPITSADVKFSFELLMKHGNPMYKTLYADVKTVKIINKQRIRFEFINGENKELALIVGELPILAKHYWEKHDFNETSMQIPLGSGPYQIEQALAGKTLKLKRVDDYWAKDLAVNKGHYNFDLIQYDYYRDSTILLEALKAGEIDFRLEYSSKEWATAYTSPAIKSGALIKREVPHHNPAGMQGFVLNLRNPLFQDIRVRKALNLAFDFEWLNKNLFYNAYTRSPSFFTNSELAATGLPSAEELTLLNPLKDVLPPETFTLPPYQPVTKGTGRNRQQLKQAKKLLEASGWKVKNNVLTDGSGNIFEIEFLVFQPSFERIINPYIKSLALLGIKASMRKVEISQYINRLRAYEFDVVTSRIMQSLSPGTEQIQFWHSESADIPAGRNLSGIKNPAIDTLVEHIVKAKKREDLVIATRALDRALLHNWYMIPQWYINSHRIAYWDKFEQPAVNPKYDSVFKTNLLSWWAKAP